jgi:rod shape-determining protein RodA
MRAITTVFIYLSLIGFCTYGILFIYSSTSTDGYEKGLHFSRNFIKQLFFYFLGIITIYVVSKTPYKKIMSWAFPFYLLNLALLIYTKFFGIIRGGAKSWIDLGVTNLQPSELMKISWVLYLASYLRYNKEINTFSGLFIPFIITAIPVLMIADQPDYGSAFIFIPTHFMILYAAGAKKRHLISIILCFSLATVPMYFFVLKPYQKKRIDAFFNPEKHALGSAYQERHSKLAIGEGHLLGKGIGKSRINQLSLLPESHTDFIFSIVASELGFVGATVLVLCFLMFLLSLCLLSVYTREPFGRIVTISFAALIGTQVFINIFVTLGMMPTTGITLPFISSGGSSFVTCCLIIGIVLSVSRHPIAVLGGDDFKASKE